MVVFGLIALLIVLVLMGVGIAIGLFACLILSALMALGVISSSLVIGFKSGKYSHGIRAFFLQCGVVAGLPAGCVCTWLAVKIFDIPIQSWIAIGAGALAGALAGLLTGLVLDQLFRLFIQQLRKQVAARKMKRLPNVPKDAIDAQPLP
ncbi:hypothetical protein JIN85_00870 [Luteolibacter pohnpeiensis]|uniref:Uncharacterized protein n=1 Tax=Luteolibacter pohnpeiensis TaxID=454153 RepID=A0A934VUN4_9BACT|nr:hypothetical protein [Luteolibacter pohnpeiensis]MBK1880943.1 hypothetical protein [Luteolibacter pohnpeiensis]